MQKIIEKQINLLNKFETINYDNYPLLTGEDYGNRVKNLIELASIQELTHILVYGDREHFSNINYLIGYDPRFEESLLIISKQDTPVLLIGNEGFNYSNKVPIKIRKELFQSFSLLGQPRGSSKRLGEIFSSVGINKSSKIGVIGWKYFLTEEVENSQNCIEIPCYIVEALIGLVGREKIENVSRFMVHPEYGLRIKLDIKELIKQEFAGTKTSRKVLYAIQNINKGLSEMEVSELLCIDGEPLATHPNVSFGAKNVLLGLASPGFNKRLSLGEVISIGLGYRRALVHRTGLYVRGKKDIPINIKNIVEELYKPYFKGLIAWYESIKIGVTGGEVFKNVENALGGLEKYGINLNPGHSIHTDEWTNSIFYKKSTQKISSGMALQCDIISSMGEPYIGVHVEDGIIIADKSTINEIEISFPESWNRIIRRKRFMEKVLGINLAEEVLPTSDMQALLFPYMADTNIILAKND